VQQAGIVLCYPAYANSRSLIFLPIILSLRFQGFNSKTPIHRFVLLCVRFYLPECPYNLSVDRRRCHLQATVNVINRPTCGRVNVRMDSIELPVNVLNHHYHGSRGFITSSGPSCQQSPIAYDLRYLSRKMPRLELGLYVVEQAYFFLQTATHLLKNGTATH